MCRSTVCFCFCLFIFEVVFTLGAVACSLPTWLLSEHQRSACVHSPAACRQDELLTWVLGNQTWVLVLHNKHSTRYLAVTTILNSKYKCKQEPWKELLLSSVLSSIITWVYWDFSQFSFPTTQSIFSSYFSKYSSLLFSVSLYEILWNGKEVVRWGCRWDIQSKRCH